MRKSRNCGFLRVGGTQRRQGPWTLRLRLFLRVIIILSRPKSCKLLGSFPQPVGSLVISSSWGDLLHATVGKISPTEWFNALLQSTVQGCLGTPLRCPE